MKSLLICHHDAALDLDGLSRWMGSFSELCGIVVIEERPDEVTRRIKFEMKRVGKARFADVLAFRTCYKLNHAKLDAAFEAGLLAALRRQYPAVNAPVLVTHSPNSPEAEAFIRAAGCDIVIARSKHLMKASVFTLPTHGTFVLHPGICPEYRNAHGCFWALANDDVDRVGVTLLRIDKGVDTGPVFGYYSYPFDEVAESHHRIQMRCVTENLDAIAAKFREIVAGTAVPIDTTGRASATWGQPWMSKYRDWKRKARERARLAALPAGVPGAARAILYHDVVDGDPDTSGFKGAAAARYKLTRARFAEHLAAITGRVAAPATILGAEPGERCPFLFTVDDGGVSSLHIADTIEQHGWRGYFLITTDRIGTEGFMTAADLRELHARGHVVGSHSCSHPYRMAELPAAELDGEWARSVDCLRFILGAPVTSASVPGGFYAPRVAKSAAKAGIHTLFTSEPTTTVVGVDGCAVVGRFNVYGGMSAQAAAGLAAGAPVAVARQKLLWDAKELAKTATKPVWDGARRVVFRA
jgi:hypothetical protein